METNKLSDYMENETLDIDMLIDDYYSYIYIVVKNGIGNKKEFNITVKDVILKAEDTQYGSEEVLIPIEGEFNVSVSKEQTLKDTNIFSPETKE